MGSSFKFIYIIAIIVVIMIVVTMGLFVMKQTHGFVDSVELDKSQISEFNSQWIRYERLQKGSTLKSLFTQLEKNAEENKHDARKLIDVAYNTVEGGEFTIISSTVKNPNVSAFSNAIDTFSVQHAYTVELIYNEKTGIITGIIIKTARNDKVDFIPIEE